MRTRTSYHGEMPHTLTGNYNNNMPPCRLNELGVFETYIMRCEDIGSVLSYVVCMAFWELS